MEKLTQEFLKQILNYNPDNGIFTWKIRPYRKTMIGAVAGGLINGYITIGINKKTYLAHRLAFLYITGSFPKNHVDHIDHDRSNNQFTNLRSVTQAQNNKNKSIRKSNVSGCVGVGFYKRYNKWRASISVDGKYIHIGYFNSIEDAAKARKKAEAKYGFHENHGKKQTPFKTPPARI